MLISIRLDKVRIWECACTSDIGNYDIVAKLLIEHKCTVDIEFKEYDNGRDYRNRIICVLNKYIWGFNK